MTDQEEFERYWQSTPILKNGNIPPLRDIAKESYQACAERKNAIIDKYVSSHYETKKILDEKDKEIEALRGFLKMTIMTGQYGVSHDWLIQVAIANRLLDGNGNPTKLLTGDV